MIDTLLDSALFLFIVFVLARIVWAVWRKEQGKPFLAMKPVQRKCVSWALACAAVAFLCLWQGGDIAIVGCTVGGLLAFGLVIGAALHDG